MTARDLGAALIRLGHCRIAVSGGVDSMTLATLAGRVLPQAALMMHAVSPAVPPEATRRVENHARSEGWRLELIDAGEFDDENYRANPVDRCFFCKGNLYGAIAERGAGVILSGTNTDDLGEYRPGLRAAERYGVRHPFVEAKMDKTAVRALARELGLAEIAALPSSPCLSSRVETAIRIEPDLLRVIHAVEGLVMAELKPHTVRCRLRRGRVVIELDAPCLDGSDPALRSRLAEAIAKRLPTAFAGVPIGFAAYRSGSAFVRPAGDAG